MSVFQQMAYDNGMCTGQDCAYISGYLNLRLVLQTGGCLPGPGNFALQTFSQGYQGRTLSQRGDAYTNGNGFMISYMGQSGIYNQANYTGQQQIPAANQSNGLQINSQFVDATHNSMNVQIMYKGQQVATGQAYGQAQYNATATAQSAAYCSQGYGGAYGSGYGYGSGGYPGGYNPYPVNTYNYYGQGSGYAAGGYIYYTPYSVRH
jgi:hypothetical protein